MSCQHATEEHKFQAGDRVIVAHSEWELNGYYGHVASVRCERKPYPMVDVLFQGRVGKPFALADVGDDVYPLFPYELEHVD